MYVRDMVYECIWYIMYGRSKYVLVTGGNSVSICNRLNVAKIENQKLRSLGDHMTYVYLSSGPVVTFVEQLEGVFESRDFIYPLFSVFTLTAMSSCPVGFSTGSVRSKTSLTSLEFGTSNSMDEIISCRELLLLEPFFFEDFLVGSFLDFLASKQKYPVEDLYNDDILLKSFLVLSFEETLSNLGEGFLCKKWEIGLPQSKLLLSVTFVR